MQYTQTTQQLSGRAAGAIFLACFGALWIYDSLASMHRLNAVAAICVAVVLAGLILPALWIFGQAAKTAPAVIDPIQQEKTKRAKRIFHLVNGLQWSAIFAAVVVLNIVHRPVYSSPVTAAIVGLHLFPLGRLYRYRPYYMTGALLIVWAIASCILFQQRAIPAMSALGTGVILWISATRILIAAIRAAQRLPGTGSQKEICIPQASEYLHSQV